MKLAERLYQRLIELAEDQRCALSDECPHQVRMSIGEHLRRAHREIAEAIGELAGAADTIPPPSDPEAIELQRTMREAEAVGDWEALARAQAAPEERGIIKGADYTIAPARRRHA